MTIGRSRAELTVEQLRNRLDEAAPARPSRRYHSAGASRRRSRSRGSLTSSKSAASLKRGASERAKKSNKDSLTRSTSRPPSPWTRARSGKDSPTSSTIPRNSRSCGGRRSSETAGSAGTSAGAGAGVCKARPRTSPVRPSSVAVLGPKDTTRARAPSVSPYRVATSANCRAASSLARARRSRWQAHASSRQA